jgi:DNA-binding response OmpR family regulator
MVCKRVKERPETKNARILAISGFIEDDEAERLADFGFDGYLKKPFGIAELNERVRELLEMPISKLARPKRSSSIP